MNTYRFRKIRELPEKYFHQKGWKYFLGEGEDWEYFVPELIALSRKECTAYADAAKELYKMCQRAAAHVIEHDRWEELHIPKNMVNLIKFSWQDAHQEHLIGRFDLAGGIDGLPIKMIEFNADTPTILVESAEIQREQLRINEIDTKDQFNQLNESLEQQFKRIADLNEDLHPSILVTTMGFVEDDCNADIIANAARKAGFPEVHQCHLHQVEFSPEEGIFVQVGRDEYQQFDYWFKIVPWEYLAYEEPELLRILESIIIRRLAVVFNPPYTLIYQSKGFMKILWELNPGHPLLLETSNQPLSHQAQVKKVVFGREGENIQVLSDSGKVLEKSEGDFGHYPSVYQAFAEMPKDENDYIYQAGVYVTNEPSCLSFRRIDGLIHDEDSEFVGHYIEKAFD